MGRRLSARAFGWRLPDVGEGSRRGRRCDQPGWLQPALTAGRCSVPGVGCPSFNLGEAGASFGEAQGLSRLGVRRGSSQGLDPEPTAPGMRERVQEAVDPSCR